MEKIDTDCKVEKFRLFFSRSKNSGVAPLNQLAVQTWVRARKKGKFGNILKKKNEVNVLLKLINKLSNQ